MNNRFVSLCAIVLLVHVSERSALADASAPTKSFPIAIDKPMEVPKVEFTGIAMDFNAAKADLNTLAKEDPVRREHRKDEDDHHVANSTIWTAFFTGILTISSMIQLYMFRKQLELTKAAAQDSKVASDAAVMNAVTAKASADAIRRGEQAHIYVSVRLHNNQANWSQLQQGFEFSINVVVTNHGKTPARMFRSQFYYSLLPAVPLELRDQRDADRPFPEGLAIGSGDSEPAHKVFRPSDVDKLAMDEGSARLYVMGVFRYKTIFDDDRSTSFCWGLRRIKENEYEFNIVDSPINKIV